jgi:hypothetical protein
VGASSGTHAARLSIAPADQIHLDRKQNDYGQRYADGNGDGYREVWPHFTSDLSAVSIAFLGSPTVNGFRSVDLG